MSPSKPAAVRRDAQFSHGADYRDAFVNPFDRNLPTTHGVPWYSVVRRSGRRTTPPAACRDAFLGTQLFVTEIFRDELGEHVDGAVSLAG